jgi:hypothetical protein
MNRAKFLRKFPKPPETPAGMVWRTIDGVTQLVPAQEASANAAYKMGNYDRYPRELRDRIKETNRRA